MQGNPLPFGFLFNPLTHVFSDHFISGIRIPSFSLAQFEIHQGNSRNYNQGEENQLSVWTWLKLQVGNRKETGNKSQTCSWPSELYSGG
jgi:hypothetical protein